MVHIVIAIRRGLKVEHKAVGEAALPLSTPFLRESIPGLIKVISKMATVQKERQKIPACLLHSYPCPRRHFEYTVSALRGGGSCS